MSAQAHCERVYNTKAIDQVSLFSPHLQTSIALIERAAGDRSSAIIDVGAGASTLVDDRAGITAASIMQLQVPMPQPLFELSIE